LTVTGRKFLKFVRMDSAQRALLIEAAFCLAVARLWLLAQPFSAVARRMGTLVGPTVVLAHPNAQERSSETPLAWVVGQAIQRAARSVPFRAVCIQQAVAGRIMLRRRGIDSVLHLGVAPAGSPEETLEAHVWLNVGPIRVTGYPVEPRFIEVACFV